MDRPAAESVIATIALAGPRDDEALRRLLRDNAVPGHVSLSYEREPNFFVASRLEGDRSQTLVAREAGRVIALGTRSTHLAYVNGTVRRIGYLSQLRLDRPHRGRAHLVFRGYQMLRQLHEQEGDAPFYVTTLIDGNRPAERLLTAGHPRMPRYRRLEAFRTLVLRVKAIDPIDARSGSPDEIRAHLDRHSPQRQFCRVWDDIRAEDFVLDRGGCLAVWDQSACKQIVVRGYTPALRLLRPLLGLPRIGHSLRMAYLSHLAAADGSVLVNLIRAAAARARERRIDYLILGLSERNALIGAVRRAFAPREYGSVVYLVHWGDAPPHLDGRPCHLEVAHAVIQGRLIPRSCLTTGQIDDMFAIFGAHFEGVSRGVFERDLAEKNWVILLEHGSLVGFSTLQVYASHGASIVYSGDTIVDRSHWGSSALATTWARAVKHLRRQYAADRMYWLLISSGFRTYRYLPTFWKEFSPRYDEPARAQLLDHLAVERFGPAFQNGIVRFEHPQRLRQELRDVPERRLTDPHIAFFVQRNPGHVQGDELACLTEISPGNLTAAGRRMWETAGELD